jgi:hypothetical protein
METKKTPPRHPFENVNSIKVFGLYMLVPYTFFTIAILVPVS